MTPLFRKLNLGAATRIHIVDAPGSFEPALSALDGVAVVRSIDDRFQFALIFATQLNEVAAAAARVRQHAMEDAVVWFAYPKGGSKRYRCEFNRDSGWQAMGDVGYEPVRQVAIDEDWSALRFRKAEFIRSMRRHPDGAISSLGKDRTRTQHNA